MTSTEADVCVIGGGPAGSSFALRLAQLGHDVVLVERERFPRLHVGEAFAAGIQVPLSQLGVLDDVHRAGVLETRGTIRAWAEDEIEQVAPATGRSGLAVDRGSFDRLLLERARACGVRVLQPASVIGLHRTGGQWSVAVRSAAAVHRVSVPFLADAAGRAGLLRASTRSSSDAETSPRTIAVAGYWHRGPGHSCDAMTRLEAAADRWYWGTPLPGGRFVGMVFCDGAAHGAPAYRDRYADLVRQSNLLTEALSGASLERVVVRDATVRAADPVGATWIRLGEASFSIDPLSSSGVQKALQTSLAGAIVVHTQLTRADRAEAAMTFYRDDQRLTIAQHARWAAAAYTQVQRFRERPFWRARGGGVASGEELRPAAPPPGQGQRFRVAPDAQLVPVPCIIGNLVDTRMAVTHPRLDRPVAFLDDIAIAPLIESIADVATDQELAVRWSPALSIATGRAVARWLVEHGILVDASRS